MIDRLYFDYIIILIVTNYNWFLLKYISTIYSCFREIINGEVLKFDFSHTIMLPCE